MEPTRSSLQMPGFPHSSAAILAGGKSTRMGSNKALLEVGGSGMLRRTAALLRPLVEDLFVVANDAAPYAALGLRVVPDVLPGRGALGGIHAALTRAAHPRVLCVACDMPFIESGILALLLGSDAGEDALLPRFGGLPEPLLAVYRRTALPAIERSLAAGRLRVLEGIEGLRVRYIEEGEIASVDPAGRCFVNVNTPGELAAARAAADEGRT